MRLIEIAIGHVLRIPDGWDRFIYRDRLYVRDEFGHFTVRGTDDDNANTSRGADADTNRSTAR